jgi:hypothetical protein
VLAHHADVLHHFAAHMSPGMTGQAR